MSDSVNDNLVLGWQVAGKYEEPRYWLQQHAEVGAHETSDLFLVAPETMATNTVILAQSGSGKSFFLGRLIEELLLKTKARCLVLDSNGDFHRIHEIQSADKWRDAEYDPQNKRFWLPTEVSRSEFEFGIRDEQIGWAGITKKIMTARKDLQSSAPYAPLQFWWPATSMQFLSNELDPLMKSQLTQCHAFVQAVDHLLRLHNRTTSEPFELIDDAENIYHAAYRNTSSSLFEGIGDELRRILSHRFDIEHVTERSGTLHLGGELVETYRRESQSAIARAADAIRYVPSSLAQFYFATARDDKNAGMLSSGMPAFLRDLERLSVIDLPSLPSKVVQFRAINSVLGAEWDRAKIAWERAMLNPGVEDERVPTFLVVDEAHNFVPCQPQGRVEESLRDQFRTILAEGRKYGFFVVLVSQRPEKLDEYCVSECGNKALMKLNSEEVLKNAQKLLGLGHIDWSLLTRCLDFKTGRVLLVGDWVGNNAEIMYVAGRRTIEGGRNLRPEHWAVPFVRKTDP